jgi:hypothetical protein
MVMLAIRKLILLNVVIKLEIQIIIRLMVIMMRIEDFNLIIMNYPMVISFIAYQDFQIDLQMFVRVSFVGLFQITLLVTKAELLL